MKAFTVGQVAKRAGVGIETVRFYERQGLVERRGGSFDGRRAVARSWAGSSSPSRSPSRSTCGGFADAYAGHDVIAGR